MPRLLYFWHASYLLPALKNPRYGGTKMFKQILVPVDGSNTSNVALHKALTLAKEQSAKVRLLTIYEPIKHSTSEGIIDLTAAMHMEGEAILREAEKATADSGVEITTTLVNAGTRRIATAIVEEGEAWGADLIFIGTHGRGGFEHLVLGSVAEGVVRRAMVPVLLTRIREG